MSRVLIVPCEIRFRETRLTFMCGRVASKVREHLEVGVRDRRIVEQYGSMSTHTKTAENKEMRLHFLIALFVLDRT